MSVQAVVARSEVSGDLDRWYRETERILGFPAEWTLESAEAVIHEQRLLLSPEAVMNRLRFGRPRFEVA